MKNQELFDDLFNSLNNIKCSLASIKFELLQLHSAIDDLVKVERAIEERIVSLEHPRPAGRLKATQVPPGKADELRQEREMRKRMESNLPG